MIIINLEEWKKNGFTRHIAERWLQHGFDLESAIKWENNGFTVETAEELKNLGYTPVEARFMIINEIKVHHAYNLVPTRD